MKNNHSTLSFKSNIDKNNTDSNNLGKLVSFFIILLLTFGMIYILNKNTHLTSDDFRYHYMYESFMPTNNVQRINSFGDIIKSMFNHYNMWGGRISAHTLVQFFLMFDKQIFNLINSIAFVVLALLIYLHSNTSKKINIPLLIGVILSLWFFIPQFGLTVLWVSGAGNYLWCTIIILLFLLPYRRYLENNNFIKDNIFNIIIMIFLGLIAGWTNENTGGAMILLTMLFIGYYKIQNIKIPKWALSGFVSSCIGFILLVVAPGNNARTEFMTKKTFSIINNIGNVLGTSFTLMFGLIILLLVILALFLITNDNRNLISNTLNISFMYMFSAISGIGALILSPQIPSRTWFGPIVLAIIAIGTIYSNLSIESKQLKLILIIALVGFTIKFVNEYTIAYKDINKTYNSINSQISIIEKEKSNGNRDIMVPNIPKRQSDYNAFKGSRYLSDKKDDWLNRWMAKYYDVNSIIGVD